MQLAADPQAEQAEEIARDPLGALREAAYDIRVVTDVLERGIHQAPEVLPNSIRELAAGLGRTLGRSAERVALAAQHLQGVRDTAQLLKAPIAVKDDTSPPPPAPGPSDSGGEGDDQT